jgi:hypothetical protein
MAVLLEVVFRGATHRVYEHYTLLSGLYGISPMR